ncbi:STM3941 family protein [Streptomyces sp. NPDC001380]|uniref:STM3941 family protein n=1 Tax=Streptomyces sp. NPDC001380 TaxID=3364566 RepID=UPI003696D636
MTERRAALPPTAYPSSLRRVLLLFLGSLAFCALGAVLLVRHDSVKAVLGGAAAVGFFGLCAAVSGSRLVRRRPELVLDEAGLDHVQLGRIAWEEVDGVRIREVEVRSASRRMIGLVLHDPAGYLARAPRIVRATASANLRLGFGPANISTVSLPAGPEEVVQAMVRHRPRLTVHR